MIIESIKFMKEFEKFQKYSEQQIANEEYDIDSIKEQFQLIFLIEIDWSLDNPYKGFRVITESKDEFVKSLPNREIFGSLDRDLIKMLDFKNYTSKISDSNKYIGSTGGLNTFSFFHFKLGSLFRNPLYKKGINKPLERISNHKLNKQILEKILKSIKNYETKEFVNELIISNKKKEKNKIILIYEQFYRDLLNVFDLLDQDNENIFGLNKLFDLKNMEIGKKDIKKKKNETLGNDKKILEKIENFLDLCEKAYVFLNYKNYQVIEEIFEQFIILRLFVTSDTVIESTCPVCGKKGKIGNIYNYTSFNEKKPFSVRFDRFIEHTLKICISCAEYLNNFLYFIKENKIKIFPLFIKDDLLKEQVDFMKKLKKDDLTKDSFFFKTIRNIQEISKQNSFDIILVNIVNTKSIIFFDYIFNYSLEFSGNSKYKGYFGTTVSKKFGKEQFLQKLISIFDLKINFFGDVDIKKKGGLIEQKHLIYKYRKKFFNTIYKNDICLSDKDVVEIATKLLENKFITQNEEAKKRSTKKDIHEILNFYLNAELFCKLTSNNFIKKNKKGEIMLDKIREEKENIVRGESFKIDSPEKFAYYLGQMVYYLISKSNVDKNKKMKLLTPLVTVQSSTNLKRVLLEKFLEKYLHELSEYKDFRHIVIAETLDYLENNFSQSFNEIKMNFYVGFFDNNIFYMSKEE